MMTGNRGILHGPDRVLGRARWTHKAWICCVLDWQGRKREVMSGRHWTELFFLDEAVAIAAGHRPCGYCRRADYRRFVTAWEIATGQHAKAPQMDEVLHHARVRRDRSQVTYWGDFAGLPQGVFVRWRDVPHLVAKDELYPYTTKGYGPPSPADRTGQVEILTPAPMVDVLQAGYVPVLNTSVV
tara:strand:+ start:7519 stop:8070 length:552 start_codon:yes stop_codon:yes gene_type:complete